MLSLASGLILIEASADVTARNMRGESALDLARNQVENPPEFVSDENLPEHMAAGRRVVELLEAREAVEGRTDLTSN